MIDANHVLYQNQKSYCCPDCLLRAKGGSGDNKKRENVFYVILGEINDDKIWIHAVKNTLKGTFIYTQTYFALIAANDYPLQRSQKVRKYKFNFNFRYK